MPPKSILEITPETCRNLAGLLTDIDDTLTTDGKLHANAYDALERAKNAGLMVVVVTGRPAGWVDHIARMWPVDGVIGENGAFYFHMKNGKLYRKFLQSPAVRKANRKKLDRMAAEILRKVPGCALASDQNYRECDLAIDYCEDVPALSNDAVERIVQIFKRHRAQAKVSSIHVNGWFGAYDKLKMTQRFFKEVKGIDLSRQEEKFIFLGDSPNDEPLFAFFTHAIGVANIARFLPSLHHPPAYIADKVGSDGFEQAVTVVLAKR